MDIINLLIIITITPLFINLTLGKKQKDGYKTILLSIFFTTILLTLAFGILSTFGEPLGEKISRGINEIAVIGAQSKDVISLLGLEDVPKTQRIEELIDIYTMMTNALPSVLVILATFISYFEYKILSSIETKGKSLVYKLKPIDTLTFPKGTVWGAIILYFATVFIRFLEIQGGDVLEINCRVLFQFFFQIQGIAVLFFLVKKKKWSNTVGVLLTIVFFLTMLGQMLLSFIGFFEMGFGLREKINRKMNK